MAHTMVEPSKAFGKILKILTLHNVLTACSDSKLSWLAQFYMSQH